MNYVHKDDITPLECMRITELLNYYGSQDLIRMGLGEGTWNISWRGHFHRSCA